MYAFYNTAYYNERSNWDGDVLYIGNHLIDTVKESLIEEYTVREGTKTIQIGSFASMPELALVNLPDSLTHIMSLTFSYCPKLTSINIPKSVTFIDDYIGMNSDSLTTISVDKDNKVYHSEGNCIIESASKTLIKGISTSVIPDDGSVTRIGDFAFYNCKGLENIIIPDSVRSIGKSSFEFTPDLKRITIPAGVTDIASSTFSGSEIREIDIPKTVKYIGESAFSSCESLETIVYHGTMAEWKAIKKGSTWNYGTTKYTVKCTDGNIYASEEQSEHHC
jgi:hypothetical protein